MMPPEKEAGPLAKGPANVEGTPTHTDATECSGADQQPGTRHAANYVEIAHHLHERGLHPVSPAKMHVFPIDHPDQPKCIGKHHPTESPCDGERGKHPAVKWSVWAETNTRKMIDREWAKHGGLANIAIACGPSNLVVLDEDKPGEIARWCVTYGITLPDTYAVSTGRGLHLYFRWDHSTKPIGNSPKATEGFKIDVRGKGGYAVAEGSKHASGAIYSGNGLPVADLPDQMARLLLAANQQPEPQPGGGEVTGHPNDTKIGHGHRHKALISYAGRLRKSGLDLAEVETVFRQRWLLCEQPEGQIPEALYHSPACPYPVTWKDARAKLRDVYSRYASGHTTTTAASMALTRLADVQPERVQWLWPRRIPLGKLVTIDGDPGLGKSTLAVDVGATITIGGTWPDGSICEYPGAVLLMSAEDGLADTVRPRFDAAGADVTKVHAVQGVPIDDEGTLRPPTIADIAALEQAITDTGARAVVIDVLMAYLPTGTDSHKDQDIRSTLSRLAALADRTNCTLLLIRHLTKAAGRDPIYRGGGSIGIVGAARAGLLVASDPDEPENRVLASVKSNLAPLPESLTYQLVDAPEHGCARVRWGGTTSHTAHTLLSETNNDEPGNPAKAFIIDYLRTHGGEASAADVLKAGRAAGFSDNELKHARQRASKPKISSRKASMNDGWVWATDPDESAQPHAGAEGAGNPCAAPSAPSEGETAPSGAPPGAPTVSTPGLTERVADALSKARNGHRRNPCPGCGHYLVARGHHSDNCTAQQGGDR